MGKWIGAIVVGFSLVTISTSVAVSEEVGNPEDEILLEDLPVDEQAAVIDAAEEDATETESVTAFTEATSQLVAYAEFFAAADEAGTDFSVGLP